MTFAHLVISALRNAASSSGLLPTTSQPRFVSRSRMSGACNALTISALSRLTTGCGVAAGRKNREPRGRFEPGHAGFDHGRHLRQQCAAALARDRERTHLARFDVRHAAGDIGERQIEHAAHEIDQRGAVALVRHVDHVHAGGAFEHLAHEVSDAAVAGRAEIELARLRFRECDEFLHRFGRHARMHHQRDRNFGDQRDRREARDRVVVQLSVEGLVAGQRRRCHQQRIAVRRGLRHDLVADVAARARPVVHHHGLSQRGPQRRRHEPRKNIGCAAGGERHDEPQRSIGIVLRGGVPRGGKQRSADNSGK